MMFFSHLLGFYRTQVNLGSNRWVRLSVSPEGFWDFTDVTLADEDTNSILTDNAKRTIQGNVAMQVTQSGGQLWNLERRQLMTKFWFCRALYLQIGKWDLRNTIKSIVGNRSHFCKKSYSMHPLWENANLASILWALVTNRRAFSSSKKATTSEEDGKLWLRLVHPGAVGGLLRPAHW